MALDWKSYYKKVLANPTASAEAKAEATEKLGSRSVFGALPSIQGDTRGAMLEGGEPFQVDETRANVAQETAQTTSGFQAFGSELMKLMREYQGLGTAGFESRALGLFFDLCNLLACIFIRVLCNLWSCEGQ